MIIIEDKSIQNTLKFPKNTDGIASTLKLYSELNHSVNTFDVEDNGTSAMYFTISVSLPDMADGEYVYSILNSGSTVLSEGYLRIGSLESSNVEYGYQDTYISYNPETGESDIVAPYLLTDITAQVTQNGDMTIETPVGYDGISQVNLSVNVAGAEYSAGTNIDITDNVISVTGITNTIGNLSSLTTTNKGNLVSAVNEVNAVAKGATKAISFYNYSNLVTLIQRDYLNLVAGQNLYVIKKEVPDCWVAVAGLPNVPYTYTTDDAFIEYVTTSGRVGTYQLAFLETEKVNLENYPTKDEMNEAISAATSGSTSGFPTFTISTATSSTEIAKVNKYLNDNGIYSAHIKINNGVRAMDVVNIWKINGTTNFYLETAIDPLNVNDITVYTLSSLALSRYKTYTYSTSDSVSSTINYYLNNYAFEGAYFIPGDNYGILTQPITLFADSEFKINVSTAQDITTRQYLLAIGSEWDYYYHAALYIENGKVIMLKNDEEVSLDIVASRQMTFIIRNKTLICGNNSVTLTGDTKFFDVDNKETPLCIGCRVSYDSDDGYWSYTNSFKGLIRTVDYTNISSNEISKLLVASNHKWVAYKIGNVPYLYDKYTGNMRPMLNTVNTYTKTEPTIYK